MIIIIIIVTTTNIMSEQKQNIYRWLHYDCNPLFAPQKYSLSLAFYSTRSWGRTKITSFNRNKSSERHIFIRTPIGDTEYRWWCSLCCILTFHNTCNVTISNIDKNMYIIINNNTYTMYTNTRSYDVYIYIVLYVMRIT